MRAKRVNEELDFERGKEPKDAMGIGIPVPTLDEINDFLAEDETFEEIDIFLNEIIDNIYMKYPKAKPSDAVQSIKTIIGESLDNWYQTTEQE